MDDEEGVRSFIGAYLQGLNYDVDMAENGEAALEKFQQGIYDLIISDMMMPKMLGSTLLQKVKALKPSQKVILMTGVKDETVKERCLALGCEMYLIKPVPMKELAQKVASCFQNA